MATRQSSSQMPEPENTAPPMKKSRYSGDELVINAAKAKDAMKQCEECKETVPKLEETYSIEQNRLYRHVESDTLYGVPGSKKTKEDEKVKFKLEFLQLVCTLRNSRGGILFIHVQERNPRYGRSLDKFDERFEDELSRMIEDDSLYHKNYTKRDWVSLENDEYEDYIVLFIEGSRSVTTQDYNTFMPHFGQIVRPKAREMAKFITEMKNKNEIMVAEENTASNFNEGERLSFYESIDKEFKRLNEKDLKEDLKTNDRPLAVVNQIVALKLFDYITSFTKLENGGIIYFGIEEERKPKNEVFVMNEEHPIGGTSDKAMTRSKTARSNQKRDIIPTFHYIVRGLALDDAEKAAVNRLLTKRIKNEMLWLTGGRK